MQIAITYDSFLLVLTRIYTGIMSATDNFVLVVVLCFFSLAVLCSLCCDAAVACGIPAISPRSEMSRVKGGNDAVAGSWPWQVRLGIRQPNGQVMWNCGGSILTDKYVVTAAHCLVGGLNAQYVIRAGDHDQTRTDTAQVDHPVMRIGQHPSYGGQSRNFVNDIAILRLAGNITFKAQISPVCVPKTNVDIPHGTTCMVTGWGKSGTTGTSYKPLLQQGRVQIIGRQQCAAQYWGNMVTSKVQVCAGTPAGTVDACSGDSGGPLVCQDISTKRWILHGIVSFGPLTGCGNPTKPAVYTRTTGLLDWIKTTTASTVLQQ